MDDLHDLHDLHATLQLCRTGTHLGEGAIAVILERSKVLQTIADLAMGNVFIDCPEKDGKSMIVVAEAVPVTTKSLYPSSIVGKRIYEPYEPAVFRAYRSGRASVGNRAVHAGHYVQQNVTPIADDEGQTIGLVILEQDITRQVRREAELAILNETTEEMKRPFWDLIIRERVISDFVEEALILLDRDGKILYANNYAIGLIEAYNGPGNGDFLNRPVGLALPFVVPGDHMHEHLVQREIHDRNKVYSLRVICLRENGHERRSLMYLRDMTELRDKEHQLMAKSAVIKEIHHRVKNNLQTVAGLLRLQLRRGAPAEAETLYQEIVNRIMSIATVHEVLSYSGIDRVNMKDIVSKLAKTLIYGIADLKCDVGLELTLDDIDLTSHQAVSLALILTELIQNSLKHAFSGLAQGKISITLRSDGDQVMMQVSDDGCGLSASAESEQLGLDIVENLSHYDLRGRYSMESGSGLGAHARITFPLKEE